MKNILVTPVNLVSIEITLTISITLLCLCFFAIEVLVFSLFFLPSAVFRRTGKCCLCISLLLLCQVCVTNITLVNIICHVLQVMCFAVLFFFIYSILIIFQIHTDSQRNKCINVLFFIYVYIYINKCALWLFGSSCTWARHVRLIYIYA